MNVTPSRDGQRRTTIRVNFRADAHLAALACIDKNLLPENLTRGKVDEVLREGLFLHGAGLFDRMERQQSWWRDDDEGEDYETRLERLRARITELTGLD